MRILVTGANGMLGIDLCNLLEEAGHTVIRTDVGVREGQIAPPWEKMDITEPDDVRRSLMAHQPERVIHTAAYTHVDGCEHHPDIAYKINSLGTWSIAAACGEFDIPPLYISTDFVFDGEKRTPYTEFDSVNPISHYGASKLAGEIFIKSLCRRHYIVRTQWLYGIHGKSFPATMLGLAKQKTEWEVVVDQIGSPTSTLSLSQAVSEIITSPLFGLYHVANQGECSWHTFAKKTLELAGITGITIHPIPADKWPSPTRRPAYSTLRRYMLELQGKDNLPHWEEALKQFITLYQTQNNV